MNTPTVYVLCGNNCKYEGMTKEQILSAIVQAVENGNITNVDKGFITTILTVNNVSIKFFYGEQSAYDALTAEQKQNLYPIITNDTFKADVNEALEQLNADLEELHSGIVNGNIVVAKAHAAETAETAEKLTPSVQGRGFIFSNDTNINLNLSFGKTYAINVCIDESYTDATFGNVQGAKNSLSFILSIPERVTLTAKYNTIIPDMDIKGTVFGNIYSNIASIEGASSSRDNSYFMIAAYYDSYNSETWTVKLKVKKPSETEWSNYIAANNSLVHTSIKCYELF